MDIPKVRSSPSDPTAPSLLTLPAEIRNKISELVFVQPEPILIHNADYYYSRGQYGLRGKRSNSFDQRVEHIDGGMGYELMNRRHYKKPTGCETRYNRYYKNLKRWEIRSDSEKQDAQLFRHEASLGLGLLKSCRQIYHETSSILYSENTFIVSRVRYSYDRSAMEACEDMECLDYHQVLYTPIWLASLGSQIKWLRKVVIDISAVCDNRLAYYSDTPDLLPLLRTIWSGVTKQCDITFASTERMTEGATVFEGSRMLMEISACLNTALAALVKDDTLHLRRHSKSRSLEPSLRMNASGRYGNLQCYKGLRRSFRQFKIDQESKKVVWKATRPTTSPMDLPLEVQDIICRHFFTHVQSFRLKMDSSNPFPLNFDRSVFDVSRRFRRGVFQTFMEHIPVTIELGATETEAKLDPLDPFRRFSLNAEPLLSRFNSHGDGDGNLVTQIIRSSVENSHAYEQETTKTTLLVRLSLTHPAQPADIRINTNKLLYWLGSIDHDTVKEAVFLTIQLEYREGEKLFCQTNTTAIGQLKMAMFLYFTDMLDQHPRGGDGGPEQPELWIDGYANLVDLAPTPTGFRSSHANLFNSEAGGRNIRTVLDDIEARHGSEDGPDCALFLFNECMCHAWRDLRPWAESVWEKEQSCQDE